MAKIKFPAEKIRLNRIYRSNVLDGYHSVPVHSEKINEVYGKIAFPVLPRERTFTYGSFVMSVDGRIAFPQSPDGTLLAKKNSYDPDGGLTDYWILMMLRALSDAVLMGSLTIYKEPRLTGRVHDAELREDRIEQGKQAIPLHVIITRSGKNLPYDHKILSSPDLPALIATTEEGRREVGENLSYEYRDLGIVEEPKNWDPGDYRISEPLAVVGIKGGLEGDLDGNRLLEVLKKCGVDTMLIESPSFLVSLMRRSVLDELYLNTSGLFVGGNALTLGRGSEAFTPEEHPHTRVLTIHTHGDHFFYSRYEMLYD